MFKVNKEIKDGTLHLALIGRLDTLSAPQLEDEVNDFLDDADNAVIDFGELEYVSSAGLRVILAIQTEIEDKDGSVVAKNVSDGIMEILEVTGFIDILELEE